MIRPVLRLLSSMRPPSPSRPKVLSRDLFGVKASWCQGASHRLEYGQGFVSREGRDVGTDESRDGRMEAR